MKLYSENPKTCISAEKKYVLEHFRNKFQANKVAGLLQYTYIVYFSKSAFTFLQPHSVSMRCSNVPIEPILLQRHLINTT